MSEQHTKRLICACGLRATVTSGSAATVEGITDLVMRQHPCDMEQSTEAQHRSSLTMMLKETEWQINKDLGSQWLADELYARGARAPFGHFHPTGGSDE